MRQLSLVLLLVVKVICVYADHKHQLMQCVCHHPCMRFAFCYKHHYDCAFLNQLYLEEVGCDGILATAARVDC